MTALTWSETPEGRWPQILEQARMSESMVERVARAIYSVSYLGVTGQGTPGSLPTVTQIPWDSASEIHKRWCFAQARAAIEAMRPYLNEDAIRELS